MVSVYCDFLPIMIVQILFAMSIISFLVVVHLLLVPVSFLKKFVNGIFS